LLKFCAPVGEVNVGPCQYCITMLHSWLNPNKAIGRRQIPFYCYACVRTICGSRTTLELKFLGQKQLLFLVTTFFIPTNIYMTIQKSKWHFYSVGRTWQINSNYFIYFVYFNRIVLHLNSTNKIWIRYLLDVYKFKSIVYLSQNIFLLSQLMYHQFSFYLVIVN